ncbi:Rieske 2Fe-2S domain-containing protein [Streptomyces polygonati]|uniref:Rieske 2Fe-2S domain-containing protein n=1 Tax=Streptomyces polygonati TaxID=1617087 RepID=A0ABV8HZS3_9ACTN
MTFAHTLTQRIEHERLLDSVAVPLAALVHKVVGARRVRNLLSGTALGHPAHPALTHLPIGTWSAAAVLDTVGGRRAAPYADLFVALGVLTAVPTALTGLNDWSDTGGEPAPRRIGVVHAAANSTALALYTCSLVARCKGKPYKGRMLGYAGFGALMAGAYLGGHLAFANAVNVNQTAFEDRPLGWTPVLADAELAEGASRKAAAGETAVLLHRRAGQVYAVSATCTHMGGPLEEGHVKDGCVTCPWHGSTFDLTDGQVVRGPATAPEPAYETRVREGLIEVRAADSGRGPVLA